MRWLAQQSPDEAEIAARKRSHHVHGSVAEADREYLGLCRNTKKRLTEGKNSATIGGGAFGENYNRAIGVF